MSMPGFVQQMLSRFKGRLLLFGALALLLALAAGGARMDAPRAEALGIAPERDAPGFSLGYQEAEEGYPAPQIIIGTDTTWTLAASPYVITTSVWVSPGVTLTVEPGVEVRFNSNLGILVDGTLVARGTASQPITFTANATVPTTGFWGFIEFTDTSVDASFDGSGNYTGGSILQYVTVQYGGSTGDGVIWLDYASPFVDHCTICDNSISGIYANNSSGLRITNNTIANNTTSYGGGIMADYSTVTISGNTIISNTTSWYGGGIYAYYGTVTISGNTIANNTASYGGGIYASRGTVTISGNTIAHNTASGYDGGGIEFSRGTVTISGNTIANNTAGRTGGGIRTDYGTVTISGNTIISNTTSWGGGGIYAYYGTVTISGNTIANNTATSSIGAGGGISGGGTIRGNKVAGNTARYYAGIYGGTTVITVITNSIVGNTVPEGSGDRYASVYFEGTTFSCNTVVSNTAPTWAGVLVSGYPTNFRNNNLYGNTSYELYNTNSYGATLFNATNNYWGATTEAGVEAEIYDFQDDTTTGIVNYSSYLTSNESCAPPSPPTGLSAVTGTNQITLSWLANPESDIGGYRVYYDTDSGFPYANVITLGTTTSYTVGPLTPGTRYYLAVAAYDTSGDESWYSAEASAVPSVPPSGGVVGWIDLQGRSNESGAVITLTGSVYTATTAADGSFVITGVAAGTYTATASMPGYLSAVLTGVVVTAGETTLPPVKLLGGNADNDGDIDIYDLTLIGANFGRSVPPGDSRADINVDGAVNIFDIVLPGINYGLAAPRPWP